MSLMHARNVTNFAEERDRPFDPLVVEQATVLAARYHIDVADDSGGFVGTVTGFSTVRGFGPSRAAALSTTRDLLKWVLAYLIESGRTPSPRRRS